MTAPLTKPAPVVGQLKSGEWVVFNMENTELWDKTFATKAYALEALKKWFWYNPGHAQLGILKS